MKCDFLRVPPKGFPRNAGYWETLGWTIVHSGKKKFRETWLVSDGGVYERDSSEAESRKRNNNNYYLLKTRRLASIWNDVTAGCGNRGGALGDVTIILL